MIWKAFISTFPSNMAAAPKTFDLCPSRPALEADREESRNFSVRTYCARDQPAVLEVFASGLLEYADQPGQEKQLWVDHIQHCIDKDLANIKGVYFGSSGHFWVATTKDDEGKEVVVGIVGLEGKSGNQGELRRMSVHADYRRYGVGRLLVACLEDWARAHGFIKVFLSSGDPMIQAHRFYKALGYQHTKTDVFPTVEMFTFEKEL